MTRLQIGYFLQYRNRECRISHVCRILSLIVKLVIASQILPNLSLPVKFCQILSYTVVYCHILAHIVTSCRKIVITLGTLGSAPICVIKLPRGISSLSMKIRSELFVYLLFILVGYVISCNLLKHNFLIRGRDGHNVKRKDLFTYLIF